MLLSSILLAFCVSIDSLGIGITYGLKNMKITFQAKTILFICSTVITGVSIILGSSLSHILPNNIAETIGSILLCFMGLFMIYGALKKDKDVSNKENIKKTQKAKVYKFFIKFLGITIKIIRNPNYSDLNHSNDIDSKEAIYLGIALSLDSIGVGIGSSVLGVNSFLFPILVACFQLIFLSFGDLIGKKIKNISNIPENIWSLLAGFLLVIMSVIKLFV